MPKVHEERVLPTDVCCRCEKSFIWTNNKKATKARLCYWCFNAPPKANLPTEEQLTYNGQLISDIKRQTTAAAKRERPTKAEQDRIDKAKLDKTMRGRKADREFNRWGPKTPQSVEESTVTANATKRSK